MTKTPYEILGVSENATDDEVKKAYRKKARENHPDLNPDDPNASKRMNEVNEAYDRIMNPEKYTKQRPGTAGQSPYGGQGGYSNPYSGPYGSPYGSPGQGAPGGQGYQGTSWDDTRGSDPFGFGFDDIFGSPYTSAPIRPEAAATDSAEVRRAIEYINMQGYDQAIRILSAIPSMGRDARWNYLSALANNGAGNALSALEHIRKAVRMDPGNPDYVRAQRSFEQTGQTYQQESQERGFSMGTVSPMTICCGLCAAQYICRFFCLGY